MPHPGPGRAGHGAAVTDGGHGEGAEGIQRSIQMLVSSLTFILFSHSKFALLICNIFCAPALSLVRPHLGLTFIQISSKSVDLISLYCLSCMIQCSRFFLTKQFQSCQNVTKFAHFPCKCFITVVPFNLNSRLFFVLKNITQLYCTPSRCHLFIKDTTIFMLMIFFPKQVSWSRINRRSPSASMKLTTRAWLRR